MKYHTEEVAGGEGRGGSVTFFVAFFLLKSKTRRGGDKNTPMVGRRAVKGRVQVRAGDVVGSPQKHVLRDAER